MENTGTVCTQVADCSLPRSNNHGRGQPQENVRLRRMGEGSGHQRQCYNCGKSGHLANVCPSKYNIATKMDKKEERKMIQTANISFFFFFKHFFSGTKHPREDNPNLYYWAEMTGLHTQTFNT